jgi:hypothetical protein
VSGKTIAALVAGAAVAAAAVWLLTSQKKKKTKKSMDYAKANADVLMQDLNKLIETKTAAPTVDWGKYDSYYTRYATFYATLPAQDRQVYPPPPMDPARARSTFTDDAQVTAAVNDHARIADSAYRMAKAQTTPAATTLPTTVASTMPTTPSLDLTQPYQQPVAQAPVQALPTATAAAYAVRLAQDNLLSWRQNVRPFTIPNIIPGNMFWKTPTASTPPLPVAVNDYGAAMSAVIVRQNYTAAHAWYASLGSWQQAAGAPPPQLPSGFPA